MTANPARFIIEVITLQRTYYLVDVMLLYAFLLALAPLALAAAHGRLVVRAAADLPARSGRPTSRSDELALPWPIIEPVFNFAPGGNIFPGLLIGYGREWLGRTIVARIRARR
ncbi:MAG: OpgC domain-containing protein [Chloroflexia bacterium]